MTAVRPIVASRLVPRAGITRSSTVRPLPQESAGPRLSLVRVARHRQDIGWRAVVLLCIVGTFAALVASVAIQGQRIALQEDADRIAAHMVEEQDRNRDLRIEVVQAESPQHVLEAARASGLVEPGPIAVVPAAIPGPVDPQGGTAPASASPGPKQAAAG